MNRELWLAVLSSSLISGVVGALIAGFFNLRSKRTEYINAYYRMALERRVKAYETVERLITMIKIAVVDDDRRPYHIFFSENDEAAIYRQLLDVMSQALWLSENLFQKTRELNLLIYGRDATNFELIEFAKSNYTAIAEIRTQIENIHGKDMLSLHEVRHFIRAKKHVDTYTPLPRRG